MLDLHATTATPPNAHDDDDGAAVDDDHCLGSELHRACSQRPCVSLKDIQGLISQNALLLQIRDPVDKWLPLHRLCRRQPSLQVIEHVVQSWPESVRQWTADAALPARLPIHLACQYGASLPVIQYLASVDPHTLAVQTTYRQYTALDYARDYYRRFKSGNEKESHDDVHSPLEVIEWLVKQQQEQQLQQQPISSSCSSSPSSICTDKPSSNSTLTMSTVADSVREGPEASSSSEFSTPKIIEERKSQEQPSQEQPSHQPPKSRPKTLLSSLRAKKEKKQIQKQKQALQDAMKELQDACWEEPPCFQKISNLVQQAYGPQAVREARTDHGQYTLLHQVCWNAAGSISAAAASSKKSSSSSSLVQEQQGNNDIIKIMTCLIQAWPESVQQTTSAGYLPLHLLVSGCSSKRAVEAASRRGGGPSSTTRTTRIGSTSTRRSDDGSETVTENNDVLLVQLVNFLVRSYPAGLLKPAHVDGFLPLHCATYCGAPLSVVKALVKGQAIVVAVKESSVVDDIATPREDAENDQPPRPISITNTSPLAWAHESIMGDMTKRPDVIAWLTNRLHEQKEQQRQEMLKCQEQERQRQQEAAIAAVATEQRELPRQQEENAQQQQQQQQQDNHTADVPWDEAVSSDMSCLPLPDAVVSNPPPTDTTSLPLPSEPEHAVSKEEQHQQQDSPLVQTEHSASSFICAMDPTSNSTEAPAATDETGPTTSMMMEPELQQDQQQQEQQQRARFTFLFRRSG